MRITIKHMPTGCQFEAVVDDSGYDRLRYNLDNRNAPLQLNDIEKNITYFFPMKVISESVIRVTE